MVLRKRGPKALLTQGIEVQMSSTWRSMWKGTRHVPSSAIAVPIVAMRWLMRTITPVIARPSRSSNVTVSPRWNSRAFVAVVTGSGGGSYGACSPRRSASV